MTSCHNISPFAVTINEKQDKTADKYGARKIECFDEKVRIFQLLMCHRNFNNNYRAL